jgi:hypothetical protein
MWLELLVQKAGQKRAKQKEHNAEHSIQQMGRCINYLRPRKNHPKGSKGTGLNTNKAQPLAPSSVENLMVDRAMSRVLWKGT